MDFQPETTIYFARTGIDETNKIVVPDSLELIKLIKEPRFKIGETTVNSFQRADNYFTIRVDHMQIPYYSLLRADTVLYINEGTVSNFPIVGNILSVDWRNANCSYVTFKIDHFMTYQTSVDWNSTMAYIEREHVREDWIGENPAFSNIGPAEDFHVLPDTPIFHKVEPFTFKPTMVMIQDPYDDSGKAVFNGGVRGGMYTSLQIHTIEAGQANSHLQAIAENQEASINNVVSVEAFPSDWLQYLASGTVANSGDVKVPPIPAPHIAAKSNPAVPKYNNAKCWSSPFTIIRIMSSEGDTIDFNPQWFGNNRDELIPKCRVSSSGGMFGGCAFTLMHVNEGVFDWNYWDNYCVMLRQLPKCPWTADGYTDWSSINMKHKVVDTVISTVGGIVNVVDALIPDEKGRIDPTKAANAALGTASTYNQIAAQISQQKATGATIQGGGGGNLFDIGNGAWGFKVVYYQAQPYLMNSIDQYFDRFGYRVNRLKKLEIDTRPYWCFVKTHECHVAQKANGGMPYMSQVAINTMFNRGVTLWQFAQVKAGLDIGDFSKAKENRGTGGT